MQPGWAGKSKDYHYGRPNVSHLSGSVGKMKKLLVFAVALMLLATVLKANLGPIELAIILIVAVPLAWLVARRVGTKPR